ncbi:hypothetical protein LAC1533_0094 [Ligilactobacillus acidipiscis]|uniref:Uncharacterized protein n=1 Tax=Ligilactobacillus acidipiscis TaxID=89059 RepID=A0A1K1KKY0_9LACO|nr:hypothetical protein LAC1533_0094 [Ligilactobacillus acidipiscis]
MIKKDPNFPFIEYLNKSLIYNPSATQVKIKQKSHKGLNYKCLN